MIRPVHAAVAAVALAAAVPLHAAAPTYSYAEASYLSSTNDKDDRFDADGFRFGASLSLQRWLYTAVEYDMRSFKDVDGDFSFGSVGVGVHTLKSAYQLFGALSYDRYDFASGGAEDSDDGYGLQFGLRVPYRTIAAQLDYKYLDFGDRRSGPNDDARYRFTGEWRFHRQWAAVTSYQMFDDFNFVEWTLGFRGYFDTTYDKRRKPAARTGG